MFIKHPGACTKKQAQQSLGICMLSGFTNHNHSNDAKWSPTSTNPTSDDESSTCLQHLSI